MRLLVTGGCGFIGSNFIHFVFKKYRDVRVINLDKLTYCGNTDNLKTIAGDTRYSFVKGDICDKDLVEGLVGEVDAVVNFAAETHVDRSIKYPEDFLKTNVSGVKVLLDAARKANTGRFIQIGTDEVYGPTDGVYEHPEWNPILPSNPYSASNKAFIKQERFTFQT